MEALRKSKRPEHNARAYKVETQTRDADGLIISHASCRGKGGENVIQELIAEMMEAERERKAWEERTAEVEKALDKVIDRFGCREILERCGFDFEEMRHEVRRALLKRAEEARERKYQIMQKVQSHIIKEAMREVLGNGFLPEVRQEEPRAL